MATVGESPPGVLLRQPEIVQSGWPEGWSHSSSVRVVVTGCAFNIWYTNTTTTTTAGEAEQWYRGRFEWMKSAPSVYKARWKLQSDSQRSTPTSSTRSSSFGHLAYDAVVKSRFANCKKFISLIGEGLVRVVCVVRVCKSSGKRLNLSASWSLCQFTEIVGVEFSRHTRGQSAEVLIVSQKRIIVK